MKIQKVKLGDLKTGDQIAVRGDIKELHPLLHEVTAHSHHTYLHHGIYDKETSSVIEMHGDDKQSAKPRKRDFTEFFSGKDQLYRVEYEDIECLPVDETMRRAEKAIKEGSDWPEYHVINNNCESFASYLKTDTAVSIQALTTLVEASFKLVAFAAKAGSSTGGSISGGSISGGSISGGSISEKKK